MEKNKLIIIDTGDYSVGINPCSWEVDVPFNITETSKEEKEEFAEGISKIYLCYCEGRLDWEYRHTKAEEKIK